MNELAKREKIKELVKEFLSNQATESREDEIALLIDSLSPDPQWSDYIFWANGKYNNPDGSLNYKKFLDKIFSFKPIIMGYTPIEDKEN